MKKRATGLSQNKVTAFLYPALFGLLIVVLWQTGALNKLFNVDAFTLPRPGRILNIIAGNVPDILTNVAATLIVAIGGLVLGSLFGFLLGVIATVFSKWGKGGLTIASAFNAIPIVAIAPIMNNLTLTLSPDANIRSMVAKTIVVTITCTVSMSVNAYRGLTNLKPFAEDLMKSYAANKFTVFLKLRLPNSVPYIFTALRVSVPACVISALVSEYFAEYIIGVGRQIRENIVMSQYATAWAYITVACLIGIVLYTCLLAVEGVMMKGRR